jgi:predicted heme/steroid binding protein
LAGFFKQIDCTTIVVLVRINERGDFMKRILVLLALVGAFGVTACAASPTPVTTEQSASTETEQTFTKEQLAVFTGQNGQPAYVAVAGVVYDVSNSPAWPNGNHNGNQAGRDLTSVFNAQHGDNRMASFPVVGRYIG